MKIISKLSFLLIALVMFSCYCDEEPGEVVTEVRTFGSFDQVCISTVGDIDLHVADEYKVIVTTHVNLLDNLNTYVRDGELIIDLDSRHKKIRRLHIDIYSPQYGMIRSEGVGNIYCLDPIISDEFSVIHEGVGNIQLEHVQAQDVSVCLEGVGNIEMDGITDHLYGRLEGEGKMELFGLNAKNAKFVLSGISDIETSVSESLEVELEGIGNVYYKGNPVLNIKKDGIGKVQNVN